ncbi:MAG: AraC family transcriptional regulator ligand-binding domain-containing protein [Aquabacterium sp.]
MSTSTAHPSTVPPPGLGRLLAPSVPLEKARLLTHVAALRGISEASLLLEAGVECDLLSRDQGEVYATEYAALCTAALRLTGDPCLGFELGMNMPPTIHGELSQALLSAGTLADALELAVTYWGLTGRFMQVKLDSTPDEVRLLMSTRMPLGALERFAFESMLTGWVYTARQLMGAPEAPSTAVMCFTAPYHPAFERYADRLPFVRFGCATNELIVPNSRLGLVLPMGCPQAVEEARAVCDVALADLTERSSNFVRRIADVLALSSEGYPTMARVAERMGITSRTLARHLDRHGLTFRQVLDEHRHQEACSMLSGGQQSVEEIATRLGYNEPANFTRAFRRWAGCTPTQYRSKASPAHAGRPF